MWEMTSLVKDPIKNYAALWARAEYLIEEVGDFFYPNIGSYGKEEALWRIFEPDNLAVLKNR